MISNIPSSQKKSGNKPKMSAKRLRQEQAINEEEELLTQSLFGSMGNTADDDDDDDDEANNIFRNQDEQDDDSEDESEDESASKALTKRGQPKSLWTDEDDAKVDIINNNTRMFKKLRHSQQDQGQWQTADLEQRLRKRYKESAMLNAHTDWASLDKHAAANKQDDEAAEDSFLSRSGPLLAAAPSRLPSNILQVVRRKDANESDPNKAVLRSVNFHSESNPDEPLLMTAGLDKTLRFFSVTGTKSTKVHGVHFPKMPIYKASFLPSTNSVLATGRRPFYYMYDMVHGKVDYIPGIPGREEKSWESHVVSPDGSTIAFLGNDGYIVLVDAHTKESTQHFKINGSVRALAFRKSGQELCASGSDGDIYEFDTRSSKCLSRFSNQDGTITSSLAISNNFMAVGAESGVVNLYSNAQPNNRNKQPIKSVMNLHTAISQLRFNHDGQILAMSSPFASDCLKLMHVPSKTVFSNWPTSKTPLKYVFGMDFSPESRYLAIGNDKGKSRIPGFDSMDSGLMKECHRGQDLDAFSREVLLDMIGKFDNMSPTSSNDRDQPRSMLNAFETTGDTSSMKYPLLPSNDSERILLLGSERSSVSLQSLHEELILRRRCILGSRVIAFLLVMSSLSWYYLFSSPSVTIVGSSGSSQETLDILVEADLPTIPQCHRSPCFTPSMIRVSSSPGFSSFWDFAHQGPLMVSYDQRAMTINGTRTLLLGGSMHPSRATPMTWNLALDQAVWNGLNLITIYVVWAAHQPLPDQPIDWGFPGSYNVECHEDGSSNGSIQCTPWNLAESIRAAAERGLFVHLRIGPYVCAEYSYGGIPEWLALHNPDMEMRRPNRDWLQAMEDFVQQTVEYITEQELWAYQGGNIIMAQIENELGDDHMTELVENADHWLLFDDASGEFIHPSEVSSPFYANDGPLRRATIQDYANWCGSMAARLAPNVTWTMCNGLTAPNTILTCNAETNVDQWLESFGGNGRIQVDQPAILTEFEGGFQTWGGSPDKPLDYFWGRTARDMARDALKWFARGGTHLNFYMFWGGYNRQRAAAAGITNMYADDVPLCPSGQRHQPKFGHFRSMHQALATAAASLVNAGTALGRSTPLACKTGNGTWEIGLHQRLYEYYVNTTGFSKVSFVENDADEAVVVEIPNGDLTNKTLPMNPQSVILLVDGSIEFDSSLIDPTSLSMKRDFSDQHVLPLLLDWTSWQEPIGVADVAHATFAPVEQTLLNIDSGLSSDYAWYETAFQLNKAVGFSKLFLTTQKANAFVVFVDGQYVGSTDNHLKGEGTIELTVDIGELSAGEHKLCLLSESLGYNNLIGRWGGSTTAKTKGITGAVKLSFGRRNKTLTDGRTWRQSPGLHGEFNGISRSALQRFGPSSPLTPTWSSALFDTPRYDPTSQLFTLKITFGRGHIWLNGRDLGRYWNITRGDTTTYTQQYYMLPHDFLRSDGQLNELTLFNSFGDPRGDVSFDLTWIAPAANPNFEDQVDFPNACI
eukprot:Nitzschia sp. Nitz4//scaffold153_size53422//3427//8120//NITZ4_006757-RA/size53422-processed-gene-0.19-mRNA-1//-1//CDS//3329537250//3306//frame0